MNTKALKASLNYLESWLDFRYKNSETPGFVVLVADKNRVLFEKSYGYANVEKKQGMTTNHLFRVASHSKMFTAVGILQLVEKQKLRVDDYVIQYLPWLANHHDKRWQKVTIRQLLSHSAGVIRDGLQSDYWQLTEEFPDTEEFKKDILAADLVIDSNVQMKYSNFGFAILGMVIEEVSGQSYQTYMTERIIKRLGLKNTGPERSQAVENKLVTGYSRRDSVKTRKPIDNIYTHALAPATGFYSSAADMAKFLKALTIGSGKLLTDESKREMQRTHWQVHNSQFREEYGFGLEITYFDNHRLFGHGGGFPGQLTSSIYDTETELAVIVFTNSLGSDVNSISDGVLGAINYFQANYVSSRPRHKLSRFEGRFMNLWGVTDVIAVGNKLISVFPGWRPFVNIEELSVVDNKTLKVTKTVGYYSAGELIHYNFDKSSSKVTSILYCSTTILPEEDWLTQFSATPRIGVVKKRKRPKN